MRCRKEEFVKGAIFHIYNHSVAEINLFYSPDDYCYFLNKLKKNYSRHELAIYAYCLMPNHFHFCIEQKSDRPIYDIFNRFIISYALHFNSTYDRKGRLFANKLQHKRINNEQYLMEICPYIHSNPIRAGMVNELKDWEFSNYFEWIEIREGILFDNGLLVDYFGDSKAYKKYIENYQYEGIEEYLFKSKTNKI